MKISTLLASTALVLGSVSLQAAVLTFQFTGQANYVGNLSPAFQVGDAMEFTISYDTNTPPAPGSTINVYEAIFAQAIVYGTGGTWTATWDNPEVAIEEGFNWQRITFQSSPPTYTADPVNGQDFGTGVLRMFSDQDPLPLADGSLPTSYDLSKWSSNPSSTGLYLYFDPGAAQDFARFSLTGVQQVPEPSSYAALFGLLGLGLLALRRRSR